MTDEPNPLTPEQQAELDALCDALKNAPTCELSDLEALLGKATKVPRAPLLDELLIVYCQRKFEVRELVDEHAVANRLNCENQIVRRAKRIAASDVPPARGDISHWTDRYAFQSAIGGGGFGRVGKYHDKVLGIDVAIKLPRDPQETTLSNETLEETRNLAKVKSPHVIGVNDVGYLWDEWDDLQYLTSDSNHRFVTTFRPAIVMEYASRGSLHERIKGRAWNVMNVVTEFSKIVKGVGDIHRADLVHRDLKPKNVLFDDNGQPRVADFGLASSWVSAASNRLGGTPMWMSPEVLAGYLNQHPVAAARPQDIWSLGVMLYQVLTGKRPFDGTDWQQRIQTGHFEPVHNANPNLDARWQQVVQRCLHIDPNHRYSNTDDLLAEIENVSGDGFRADDHGVRHNVHYHQHIHTVPPHDPSGATGSGGKGGGGTGSGGPIGPGGFGSGSSPGSDSGSFSMVDPLDDPLDRRVANLYIGHEAELAWLNSIFGTGQGDAPTRNADDLAKVAFLHGGPGSGKSYLVDRWLWQRKQLATDSKSYTPVIKLTFQHDAEVTLETVRDELAARWKLKASGDVWAMIRASLSSSFLRIENVDSEPLAAVVAQAAKQLDGCRLILSGRWFDPGQVPREWHERTVPLLSHDQSEQLFRAELPDEVLRKLTEDQWQRLLEQTAGLPLAIHLACGYLKSGWPVDRLFERLSSLKLGDMDDPRHGQVVVQEMAKQSMAVLTQALEEKSWLDASMLSKGMHRLGHGPLSGMGLSLGAAIAGLSEPDLADLLVEANFLHLVTRESEFRFRFHPLLAEQFAQGVDRQEVDEDMTDWFCERLPKPMQDDPREKPWIEIQEEAEVLPVWLSRVPEHRVGDVLNSCGAFAFVCGPFTQWIAFCDRVGEQEFEQATNSAYLRVASWLCLLGGELSRALSISKDKLELEKSRGDLAEIAEAAVTIGDVHNYHGRLEEALKIWTETALPSAKSASDDISVAHIHGRIADVLQARGELDEALRIRREEQLPVYGLGDVREKAVTQGKIADVLQARGELDEALRIRREEELPVYDRLGDVRSKAVTQGKIADVLQARGELDEDLRIRREEELPVYDRLGDVRSKAVTQGKIADVLQARGELDEALRIRREEELPVYDRLGDVRSKAVTQGQIADVLQARGELDEALRIRREEQLPVYDRLGDVRSKAVTQGRIADVLQARGELDEALRIRREEELPVYDRLGDVREKAVTQGKIADVLQARGELDEALRIRREEVLPVCDRLGDVRDLLIGRAKLAANLLKRNAGGDRQEARELLRLALEAAEAMQIPEAETIRKWQAAYGLEEDA